MKKSILILCAVLITFSLTAFGVINWQEVKTEKSKILESKKVAIHTTTVEKANPDANYAPMFGPILTSYTEEENLYEGYNYNFGPRFGAFKKSKLVGAKSIEDFFKWEELQSVNTIKSIEIVIVENDIQTEKRIIGYSNMLTEAQLQLLKSLDYASHFIIKLEYLKKNKTTGVLEDTNSAPHLTIVPEKQATYSEGRKAFMKFFDENSKEARTKADVDQKKLQPAMLYFIVTKEGMIKDVKLDRSSNYPLIDETMLQLINNLPGTWKPAENEKGEKMEQELVVSFGLMGC
ncbi:energy transducer TonB [Lacinutrix sp. MEBiC02404]